MKQREKGEKRYWLIKSEEGSYPIDSLKREKRTLWTGIRNYQARNFLRDDIKTGDLCLFYHSAAKPLGVYGIARVVSGEIPDPTQFDKKDYHFDPKATKDKPIWFCVEVAFVRKFTEPVSLADIKRDPHLEGMLVARRGVRLSVMPVSKAHFEYIDGNY